MMVESIQLDMDRLSLSSTSSSSSFSTAGDKISFALPDCSLYPIPSMRGATILIVDPDAGDRNRLTQHRMVSHVSSHLPHTASTSMTVESLPTQEWLNQRYTSYTQSSRSILEKWIAILKENPSDEWRSLASQSIRAEDFNMCMELRFFYSHYTLEDWNKAISSTFYELMMNARNYGLYLIIYVASLQPLPECIRKMCDLFVLTHPFQQKENIETFVKDYTFLPTSSHSLLQHASQCAIEHHQWLVVNQPTIKDDNVVWGIPKLRE
jgi:hypothetical protein